MMQVKLSHELKTKILNQDRIESRSTAVPQFMFIGGTHIQREWHVYFSIRITGNKKLITECNKWVSHIETYFKTSYDALKVDIGAFQGLWPTHVNRGRVYFRADMYDSTKKSWKDWFIVEEIEDAPQFIA